MAVITGTTGNDTLTIQSDTTSVQAGAGTDTVIFSGNYADYTLSQSDSYVPIMTHNTSAQAVSLFGVEQLQFDDTTVSLVSDSRNFLVNTETSDWQSNPSTTALNDGGFVITWESYDQDGSSYGVYAQRHDADGSVNGNEFLVNTETSDGQYNPSTTALSDGGFVITWHSHNQDGSSYGVYAQRYDADGSANGGEFQVNTYTSSDQLFPSTTALNDGGFVITWQSYSQDGDGRGVYAQRYDADGSVNGNEFQVNTYTSSHQLAPSTTALNDGGFVITWESYGQDGSGYGVYAQRYDADGSTNGGEFLVNTETSDWQYNPSTTALSDGGFVITWESFNQDGDGWGVYAQRYDAEGNALGVFTSIAGTTADDILNGTLIDDNIYTLEGADVVYALTGNDDIALTADATWSTGYSAKNVSNDNSVGTNEKISLGGLNRFNDVIDGGNDVDTLILTTGNDAFFIHDVYSEHHSSLTLSSTTQGIDSTARVIDLETIEAGSGNDIVDLTSTNFVLAEAVEIYGEAGNDHLWGSNGDDVINGGTGNDSLFGGSGSDTLTGGTGSDVFQFTATAGSDVITDFDTNNDAIQLYYRATDNHTNADLNLVNGILTWNVDDTSNDVLIDVSATIVSSNLNDLDSLITFVEIV